MSFYTFVDRCGSKIFHRYIDNDGKRHQETISDAEFKLYLKSDHGEHRSLYGDSLCEITKRGIRELNDFLSQMDGVQDVFGQTDPISQFVASHYPGEIKLDYSALNILGLDIEVRFDGYEESDLCTVRRRASLESEQWTVGKLRKLRPEIAELHEVHDEYTGRWYALNQCPQLYKGGFPDPGRAECEITAITLLPFGKKPICISTLEAKPDLNFQFIHAKTEEEMLRAFIYILRDLNPDIITGWNCEMFDMPYLVNRIEKILDERRANMLSPFSSNSSKCISRSYVKETSEEFVRIQGITILDYMVMYKTPSFNLEKLEKYTLDFVAKHEGIEGKLDFDGNLMDLMRDDPQRYIEYNVQDVKIIERMEEQKRFIQLAMTTALMTKSRIQDVNGKIRMLDNLIYNMALDDGMVIPPNIRCAKREIVGAYVKEPIPGLYRWIASLDLTSLYPSIDMMFNMSPETKVRTAVYGLKGVEMILEGAGRDSDEPGICMTANGAMFDQTTPGVLPRAMRFVFDTRKAFKKRMIEAKKRLEAYKAAGGEDGLEKTEIENEVATFNASQGAMKILANSLYGCSANVNFRYYDHDIAEGITITGQLVIRYIGDFINEYLNGEFGTEKQDYVITSDTDSCYIILDRVPSDPNDATTGLDEVNDFVNSKLQPAIDAAFRRLGDRLGAKENLLDMKREAISTCGFWRGKKNYAIYVLDNEGVRYAEPELKIMGLEPKRSDRSQIVRDELTKAIKIILEGTNDELIDAINAFRKKFRELDLSQIAKPMGVNGVEKYEPFFGHEGVRIPWHVQAALAHNKLVDDLDLSKTVRKIKSGTKLYTLKLLSPNPIHRDTIAFVDDLPVEFNLHDYINIDHQFETYMTPVTSYCDAVGWKSERISSFADLF